MPAEAASEQACAMEHSLTDEAMDRMVRFFEFLGACPVGHREFSPVSDGAGAQGDGARRALPQWCSVCAKKKEFLSMSLADVKPGQSAVVTKIDAVGALRQRLLDMGVLPETTIDIERVGLGGDPFWVRCQGARLALRRSEAQFHSGAHPRVGRSKK